MSPDSNNGFGCCPCFDGLRATRSLSVRTSRAIGSIDRLETRVSHSMAEKQNETLDQRVHSTVERLMSLNLEALDIEGLDRRLELLACLRQASGETGLKCQDSGVRRVQMRLVLGWSSSASNSTADGRTQVRFRQWIDLMGRPCRERMRLARKCVGDRCYFRLADWTRGREVGRAFLLSTLCPGQPRISVSHDRDRIEVA